MSIAFGFVNLCWLVLLIFAAFRLRNWRCPRCGGPFFANSERRGLSFLTKNCGNCQLQKFSEWRPANWILREAR